MHDAIMPRAVAQAFEDYYLMPDRSLRRLAAQYRSRSAGGQVPPTRRFRTLAEWSTRYGWRERVAFLSTEEAVVGRIMVLERITQVASEAAETLEQLLWATKTLVLPTGQAVEVPDNEVRLNAALAILDRSGLCPQQYHDVAMMGPGGGPLATAAVTLDVTALSSQELVAHLRESALGDVRHPTV